MVEALLSLFNLPHLRARYIQYSVWVACRTFKVEHVKKNPWAEACWYFPDSREQFRLGGDLVIIGPDHPDAHLREASLFLALCCSHSDMPRVRLLDPAVVQCMPVLNTEQHQQVIFRAHALIDPSSQQAPAHGAQLEEDGYFQEVDMFSLWIKSGQV